MEFGISLAVSAFTLDGKPVLLPSVDANELFSSFGNVEGNPDAISFTIDGVTYSAYPKDVYVSLIGQLEQMVELFAAMSDEQRMFIEHAYEELRLIAAEHTDCEACDLTKFIESEEAHYEQSIDARGDEE